MAIPQNYILYNCSFPHEGIFWDKDEDGQWKGYSSEKKEEIIAYPNYRCIEHLNLLYEIYNLTEKGNNG